MNWYICGFVQKVRETSSPGTPLNQLRVCQPLKIIPQGTRDDLLPEIDVGFDAGDGHPAGAGRDTAAGRGCPRSIHVIASPGDAETAIETARRGFRGRRGQLQLLQRGKDGEINSATKMLRCGMAAGRRARCAVRLAPSSRLPHACDAVPRRAAGTYLSSSPPGTSVHTSSKYLILLPQSRLLFISSLKTLPFRRTKKNRKSRSSRPTNPPPWLPPQTSRCRTSTAPGSWYVPAGECTRGDGALLLELLFPFCLFLKLDNCQFAA